MQKQHLFFSLLLLSAQWVYADQPALTCIERMNQLADRQVYGPHNKQPTAFSALFSSSVPEAGDLTYKQIYADYKQQGGKESLATMQDKAEQWCHNQNKEGSSRIAAQLREVRLEAQKSFIQRYASLKSAGLVLGSGMLATLPMLWCITGVPIKCIVSALQEKAEEYTSYPE